MAVAEQSASSQAATYEAYYSGGTPSPAGVRWTHQRADGSWCAANFPFRGHGNERGEWTIILAEPLTATPVLRCPTCRSKAWLDGGKLRAAK